MSGDPTTQIVNRVWRFAYLLRDDGLSYMACTEQITFLLLLEMAHERPQPPWRQAAVVPSAQGTRLAEPARPRQQGPVDALPPHSDRAAEARRDVRGSSSDTILAASSRIWSWAATKRRSRPHAARIGAGHGWSAPPRSMGSRHRASSRREGPRPGRGCRTHPSRGRAALRRLRSAFPTDRARATEGRRRLRSALDSTGEPHSVQAVACDAAAVLPGLGFPEALPAVMLEERTFREKATSMHVCCRQGRVQRERWSRHWHDLVRLDDAGIAAWALTDRELALSVARPKAVLFRENDSNRQRIDCHAAVSGDLRLVPSGTAGELW